MIAFRIQQWRAPGLSGRHDGAQSPPPVIEKPQQPECLSLPRMQRRRLSRLARMTMEVACPLRGEDGQLPFVFGWRHGETARTLNLLDVAAGQPLSLTHFGLSVHNAIAGRWSPLHGRCDESVATAGEADTFEHAKLKICRKRAPGRHEGETTGCTRPHALDFLRARHAAQISLARIWETRQWQWQCTR